MFLFSSAGAMPGNIWPCLFILGNTWQYFYNAYQYKTILTNLKNIKQYLANLVVDRIIWYWQYIKYCRKYDNSVAMVSAQNSTDGSVPVWYIHGTKSGYFHKKPFMPNSNLWSLDWESNNQPQCNQSSTKRDPNLLSKSSPNQPWLLSLRDPVVRVEP